VHRISTPRHERLQSGDDVRSDEHGVDRLVRRRGMAAPAQDLDFELVDDG